MGLLSQSVQKPAEIAHPLSESNVGPDLTAVVLTYNEELHVSACLKSIGQLGCEVFVVDSGSTDRTVEIAEAAGAQVVHHPFQSHAHQLNWALDHLPVKGRWVLRLDADERLTPELARELQTVLQSPSDDIGGFYLKRRVHFMGRWIRHGGYYPIWLLRVWRRDSATAEERHLDPHPHMILLRGQAAFLRNDIEEHNDKGLFDWVRKHNEYAIAEAEAQIAGPPRYEISASLSGSPDSRKRWLRKNLYNRVPLFARAFLYFLYRYFIRFGFLDGKEGLVFHFLQGCWYRFQVDAFILESRLSVREEHSQQAVEETALSLPKRKNVGK